MLQVPACAVCLFLAALIGVEQMEQLTTSAIRGQVRRGRGNPTAGSVELDTTGLPSRPASLKQFCWVLIRGTIQAVFHF